MGEAQLVLQDSLAIRQRLNLIGEGVESICQRVREVKILHALLAAMDEEEGKRSIKKEKMKEEKKAQGFEEEEKGKRFAQA